MLMVMVSCFSDMLSNFYGISGMIIQTDLIFRVFSVPSPYRSSRSAFASWSRAKAELIWQENLQLLLVTGKSAAIHIYTHPIYIYTIHTYRYTYTYDTGLNIPFQIINSFMVIKNIASGMHFHDLPSSMKRFERRWKIWRRWKRFE